jgi:hypothetical protein
MSLSLEESNGTNITSGEKEKQEHLTRKDSRGPSTWTYSADHQLGRQQWTANFNRHACQWIKDKCDKEIKGEKQVVNQQNQVGIQSRGALSNRSKRKCHSHMKTMTRTSLAKGRKSKNILHGRRKWRKAESQDLEEGNGESEMAGAALCSMLSFILLFFVTHLQCSLDYSTL